MKILTVIPITSNPRITELTYFSLQDVPLGAIVQVPMQKREIPALVIKTDDAGSMKAILRGGEFTLKRIGVTKPSLITPPTFITMAQAMAHYYATTTGMIINTLLPKALLTSDISIISDKDTFTHTKDIITEIYALQSPKEDRISVYKNLVREAFAKGESILVITPTITAAQSLFAQIQKGLEDRSFVLTSKNTKIQQLKVIKAVHENTKPVLLVATAKYAILFRHDIGTIIIEDETSQSYNTLKRPYLSMTHCIKAYAQIAGIKLILGSTVLAAKTHLALKKGPILELAPPSVRARSDVTVHIIDNRLKEEDLAASQKDQQKAEAERKKPFTTISESLHGHLQAALHNNKKIFILAPSRGLAPLTVCRDCKTPVLCSNCDTPITLRKRKDGVREFLCYKCGETKDTDTTCTYCDSWRLDTLGIGIEKVEEELKKAYSDIPTYKIDTKTTKTDKQVNDVMKQFEDETGASILIGTQKTLTFLESVDISVVISLDAMLSVPSFQIDEQVFSLLLKIKDSTKEKLFIQTRMPDRSALTHAKGGDISAFISSELELRKVLSYPPYTVMIKITATGTKRQIIKDFQKIMPTLEPYGPRVFKQFYQITPSKFALHALLRIDKKEYTSDALTEVLRNIQPMFEVRVGVE